MTSSYYNSGVVDFYELFKLTPQNAQKEFPLPQKKIIKKLFCLNTSLEKIKMAFSK